MATDGSNAGTTDPAEPSVRLGDVNGSAFSIGGSNNTNTVRNEGAAGGAVTPQVLLDAVLELRAALVRAPRGADRSALDAELDNAAEELE
ncbi:hypothetical protein, partial [Streptomyces sp. NPDC054838]